MDISVLIKSIGIAPILVCIFGLGFSFFYIWNHERLGHNIIVGIAAALAFALAVLGLAVYGENERSYWTTTRANGFKLLREVFEVDQKVAKYSRVLMCAFSIAVFVFSLVPTVFTVFVFIVFQNKAILRRVSLSLCTRTGALKLTDIPFLLERDLIPRMRDLAPHSAYVLAYYREWFIRGSYEVIPAYVEILDAILNFVPTFVVLCLL